MAKCENYRYIESAADGIRDYLHRYGSGGKDELNNLASTHIIIMAPSTNPKINYSDCEISNNSLKVVFTEGFLGFNITFCMDNIGEAANSTAGASGAANLNFNTKQGIKKKYDSKTEDLKGEIKKTLITPRPRFHA